MADEEAKAPKTKTLGHIDLAKLETLPKWKDFSKKAEAARLANEAHEASKKAMREEFKKTLKLPADTKIDFSTNGNRVTITQFLEVKKSEKPRADDLSHLFS